ncbi:MAG TPA: hypothetical protein VE978_11265 [Chitinophagales bacterium]|nr:hypothetical protein [Chitinophagales bacterium]
MKFFIAISKLVYSLVGLLFWIPFVFRSILFFAGFVLFKTVSYAKFDSLAARERLSKVAVLYTSGFRVIEKQLTEKKSEQQKISPEKNKSHRIVLEIMFAIFFWGTLTLPFTHELLFEKLNLLMNYFSLSH